MPRIFLGLLFLTSLAAFGQPEVHINPSTAKGIETSTTISTDHWVARNFELKAMIARVYKVEPARIEFPLALDDGKRYDFSVMGASDDAIKQAIEKHFSIAITREARSLDAFVLASSKALAESPVSTTETVTRLNMEDTEVRATGMPMDRFAAMLEERLGHPVVNETNLKGRYDFEAHGSDAGKEGFLRMLRDQLGFALTAGRREIQMLVVKKL